MQSSAVIMCSLVSCVDLERVLFAEFLLLCELVNAERSGLTAAVLITSCLLSQLCTILQSQTRPDQSQLFMLTKMLFLLAKSTMVSADHEQGELSCTGLWSQGISHSSSALTSIGHNCSQHCLCQHSTINTLEYTFSVLALCKLLARNFIIFEYSSNFVLDSFLTLLNLKI